MILIYSAVYRLKNLFKALYNMPEADAMMQRPPQKEKFSGMS
jgi:hypothetical protein